MASVKAESSIYSQDICSIPMLIPCPLKSLLSSVKNINVVDTADEVLEALKDYIYKNRLFDNQNPHIIHCENDALKDVLGVPQFNLSEIKRLILKMMIGENRKTIKDLLISVQNEQLNLKRKAEEATNQDAELKKACLDQPESAISLEKLNVNDNAFPSNVSSDEWSCFDDSLSEGDIFAVNHTYDIEYEADTTSSEVQTVTDSDSEIEDLVKVAAVTQILKADSDVEFWADRSSEDECYNSDVEIPDSDKWLCKTCGSRNQPLTRCCLKCWKERKGWSQPRKEHHVPPRHKSKKLRTKVKAVAIVEDECEDVTCKLQQPCSSQDTLCSSQQSSQDFVETSQEDAGNFSGADLCTLCFRRRKNASVIHGKVSHQFSCYRCARKLLSLNKPCPICRRNIERVCHHFIS